jgi:uncharacterized protein YidB (DUF937 family)
MGLFDSLRSEFGQVAESEMAALLPVALQAAGLGNMQSVVNQLQHAGLGQQVQAWASGQAAPISADELKAILNNDQIQALAHHFGVDPSVVLNMLAQHLPSSVATAAQSGEVSTSN